MATNPDNPNTGRSSLNEQLKSSASQLGSVAQYMAQGATATEAASSVLKDVAFDKLLGPTSLFAGGMIGALQTIRRIVKESNILENGMKRMANVQGFHGQFETLLKSASLAKKRIEELYKFTANSPFRFEQVAEANRILQALTKGAFAGADAMKLIGDAAAGSGQQINEVAEKVGKLYNALASGRSLDKIIFQLQLSGLATEELIGKFERLDQQGASFAEKWAEVEKVLKRTEDGMANAKSINDLTTKLEEAQAAMERAFATPYVDARSRSIEVMTEATKNLTPVVAQIGADFAIFRGLIDETKTSLLNATLATQGAQTALLGMWEAAKLVGAAVGGTALVAIGRTVVPLLLLGKASLGAAIGFGKVVSAGSLLSKGVQANNLWLLKLAEAQAAVGQGSLISAAGFALQAVQSKIAYQAARVHAAGLASLAASQAAGNAQSAIGRGLNYAYGASVAAVGGAARVAGVFVKGFVLQLRASAVALLTNPIFLLVAGLASAVTAYFALTGAAKAATEALAETNKQVEELNKKLKDQFDAASNTDQWAEAMAGLSSKIKEADSAARSFRETWKSQSWVQDMKDALSGAGNTKMNTAQALREQAAALRALRLEQAKNVSTLDVGSAGSELFAASIRQKKTLSDQDFDDAFSAADPGRKADLNADKIAQEDLAIAEAKKVRDRMADQASNPIYQTQVARTDNARDNLDDALANIPTEDGKTPKPEDLGEMKKRLEELLALRSRMDSPAGLDLNSAAAKPLWDAGMPIQEAIKRDLEFVRRAQVEARRLVDETARLHEMRLESDDELSRLLAQEDDASAMPTGTDDEKAARDAELIRIRKRRQEVLAEVESLDSREQANEQRKRDQTSLGADRDVAASNTGFDGQINAAIQAGDDAGAADLKFEKQMAELAIRREEAIALQNAGLAEQITLQMQTLEVERNRARQDFARDRAIDREANAASIFGDRKEAQAIRDAEAIRKKQEEYAAMGLSPEQATDDFTNSLLAGAAGQPANVVASSIQSIGGGGGFAAGDPLAAAQERAERAREAMIKYLAIIAGKDTGIQ